MMMTFFGDIVDDVEMLVVVHDVDVADELDMLLLMLLLLLLTMMMMMILLIMYDLILTWHMKLLCIQDKQLNKNHVLRLQSPFQTHQTL